MEPVLEYRVCCGLDLKRLQIVAARVSGMPARAFQTIIYQVVSQVGSKGFDGEDRACVFTDRQVGPRPLQKMS